MVSLVSFCIRLADSNEAKASPYAVRGWLEKQNRLADRDEAKAKLNAVRGWIEKGTLLAELAKYGQDYEKLELVPILTPAGNKQGIQTPVVYEQVCVCVCVCLKTKKTHKTFAMTLNPKP